MLKLISKKTSKLSNKEIRSICLLKNTHWKYGINYQLTWFKKNVKSFDIHNMLLINKELVGYTLLRVRKMKSHFISKYFLFDTIIIKKEFRKRKLSNSIMNFNNSVIKKNKKISFLLCEKKLIKYYNKYGWVKLNKKKIRVMDGKFNKNGMIFNCKKRNVQGFFSFWLH